VCGPGVRVTRLNDQHIFLQVPEELRVGLGEVWSFGISHPAAFDRWPAILLVEQRHQIAAAVTGPLISPNRSLSFATWLLTVTTSSLRLPGLGGCLVRLAVHPRGL
jgi:hypothetical protein